MPDDVCKAEVIETTVGEIATGDRDLLALNPFRGIPIVTPAAFVQEAAS